ncbi:carboxylesterase [Advenella kashmirensis W13003]|uniref:Carboxylesterase n=2 Tax=Advenella kashmirensis TaxID=310575 RepID=V8QM67_9BURK|nr:carboxylesterase [Advenella kashmirensis W13003]
MNHMENLLDCVEIEHGSDKTAAPSYSVIWMHGLGADANDFVPVIPELRLPEDRRIRFVFPNAPVRPVTINNQMPMRAWYDIIALSSVSRDVDETGLRASQTAIEALIRRENERGVPTERIILAGFSQGCAMAYQTGLRSPARLAGLICLSGYLPMADKTANEHNKSHLDMPIFIGHGTYDPVVNIAFGEQTRDWLAAQGYTRTQWHTYPMAHSVNLDEINDISAFLQSITGAA